MDTNVVAQKFSSPTAEGKIYPLGAHVASWIPAGEDPVLWMSDASVFETGSAIRGGVPICFPWFGAGRSGKEAPAHGTARIVPWTKVAEEVTDSVRTVWELKEEGKYTCSYEVVFGTELTLALTVTNDSDADFDFEEALHTYLAVSEIKDITVEGLDGVKYLDRAGGKSVECVQEGDIKFVEETDRIYFSTGDVTVVDPGNSRKLVISRTNSANAVVWNPWITKAAAMADYGDNEWPDMVCVEAANALDNAIVLAPGESHTMGYKITVVRTD